MLKELLKLASKCTFNETLEGLKIMISKYEKKPSRKHKEMLMEICVLITMVSEMETNDYKSLAKRMDLINKGCSLLIPNEQ